LVEYVSTVRLIMKSTNLSTHKAVVCDILQTRYSHATRIQARVVMLVAEGIKGTTNVI